MSLPLQRMGDGFPREGTVDLSGAVRQVSQVTVQFPKGWRGRMGVQAFNEQYYEDRQISEDRIAMWWYARVLQRLRPQGGRLLDFGCGTGHLLKRLSPQFETFGYDAAPFARSRCRTNAPNAVVLEEWDTLSAETFEVIVSLHTLEHLPRPLGVLERFAKLLVHGGVLFFVVPNSGGLGRHLKGAQWSAYSDPTHVSLLSRGEWATLVRKVGLQIVAVRGDGLWDAPYVRFIPTPVQRVLFGAPAALQVYWPFGQPFLPASISENLIVTARKG